MATTSSRLAPLAGVTVLEEGCSPAVAMCGKLMAGLGASVSIVGAGEEGRFGAGRLAGATGRFLDQGKTIVPGDGVADARHRFDVVLTSAELGDAALPDGLICVHFTAFGDSGPAAGRASSELVAQAAGGLLALLGDPTREPLMLAGRQSSYSTALLAFTAVMAALRHRDRRRAAGEAGGGQRIELSDLETIAFLEWKGPVYYQASDKIVPRGRETGPLVLPCSDGHLAFFYNPAHWTSLVEMLGSPPALCAERFATPAGRMAAETELKAILSELTRKRRKHELYHLAQARGVPVGAVETTEDLKESPQYAATGFLRQLPGGAPGTLQPSLPFTFNGVRPDGADLAFDARAQPGESSLKRNC